MRMSRRIALYSAGGGKAMCFFRGAVSETLTIQQDSVTVATVSTNSNGDTSSVELKPGTYTITGSVSGYTKTVTIKKDGTYNAYPAGMLYWYGRFASGMDAGATNLAGGAPSVKQTNYLVCNMADGSYGSLYLTPAIARGSNTKLKAVAQLNPQNGQSWAGTIGLATNTGWSNGDAAYGMVKYSACTPNVKTTYSIDISDVSDSEKYYIKLHNYGDVCYLHAAWFEGDETNESEGGSGGETGVETLAGTNSITVSTGTYRYTTENTTYPWESAQFYDTVSPVENYVGHNSSETNTALIPIGSFAFNGTSTKLVLTFSGYCPSVNFGTKGFRWSICTSNANKTLYQGQTIVTGDSSQLATGTATFAYNSGNYKAYTVTITASNIPANTTLYLYLQPNGTSTDIAHIKDSVSASLYYEG